MTMRELIAATALAVLLFALANGGRAAGPHTHTGEPFAGVKANTGTVTHSKEGGKSVLTLSDEHMGTIKAPELPANFAWGDDDGRALYMTARTGLYRIR